jgi:outer membrane protein assembly factor BamB
MPSMFHHGSTAARLSVGVMAACYASAISASSQGRDTKTALRTIPGGFPCGSVTTELWNIPSNSLGYTPPVIGPDGILITAAIGEGTVIAVNTTGLPPWSYVFRGSVLFPPAVDATTVYVTSGTTLVALSVATGAVLWSENTGNQLIASPATGPNNGLVYATAYTGTQGGYVYAFTVGTGTIVWSYHTDSPIIYTPAIGPDGTVYVSWGYHVTALNGVTGTELWVYTAGVVKTPIIGAQGLVYVASNDGSVSAVNGSTGERVWLTFFSGQPLPTPASIGADGTVYIGTTSGVYAFHGTTGTMLWSYVAPGRLIGPPAVTSDGTLILATDDALYALQGSTGNQTWNYTSGNLTAFTFTAPTLGADGTIYIAGRDVIVSLHSSCPRPTPAPGPAAGAPPDGGLSSAAAATIGVLVPLAILGVVAGVWLVRRRRLGHTSLWGGSTYDSNRERLLQLEAAMDEASL